MIVIGLTGSIGMGKTTTAGLFAEEGIPVWDADGAVHRLYKPGAPGADAVSRLAPGAVGEDGVDRDLLRARIAESPDLLAKIEAAIHPLVARDREGFLNACRAEGRPIALCDIPLLFETGADRWLDHVVVVSAPAEQQRARVLARPGMTEAHFAAILAKQTPDAEKRARADTIVDTGQGIEVARAQVRACLAKLRKAQDA